MSNLKTVIVADIVSLHKSEVNVKAKLAVLSRNMLMYVPDSNDIGMVNRLISGLTPMNKRTAQLFFQAFLPWKLEKEAGIFTSKLKGKGSIDAKLKALELFLKNEENTIWTWAEENVQVEAKPKNYAAKIAKLVERGLNDEQEGISHHDIIKAVITGGVNVSTLITYVEAMKVEIEAIEESDKETEEA